jgi:hypothetical protein
MVSVRLVSSSEIKGSRSCGSRGRMGVKSVHISQRNLTEKELADTCSSRHQADENQHLVLEARYRQIGFH